MKEVLIIGGGFAGLAAAVELTSRGFPVTLLERKTQLGGRAYSFKDPVTGSIVDNGQHLLMGCYRETLAFLKKIGTLDRVRFQRNLRVHFAGPKGVRRTFRALPLPAPWHILGGSIFFGGFSLADRARVFRMKNAFKNGSQPLDQQSVSSWLHRLGQTESACRHFWDPVALATLNDRPDLSSAALYEAVLREALFSRKGSRLVIPKVGLSDLYTEPAREFIESHGGRVITQAKVVRLHFHGREFQEVELEEGRRISAEELLITVPFTALRRLLPDGMLYQDPFFAPIHSLQNSPIVAINLWFDRDFVPSDFFGFWGTHVQWLFHKGRIIGSRPYLSLVISGAREELGIPGPKLIERTLRELIELFPKMKEAKLLHSMVSKEPEATMAPAVGVGKLRLPQKTPYKGLTLAGDWTDTGLPATIESAVRSAKKAVELIARED